MCVYVWGEVHGHTDASVCMYTNADKVTQLGKKCMGLAA